MNPADPAFRYPVVCPGCGRTLGVPVGAVGKPAHCPHCRAAFDLPANPDGSPAAPVPRPPRRGLPRPLIGPAVGLLLLGSAGTFVGAVLAVQFATVPGADRAYAGALIRQIRAIEGTNRPAPIADPDWEQLPFAAALGAAAAAGSGDVLEAAKNAKLAAAWTPSVVPRNRTSLALSAITLAGGLCTLAGRGYWLALLGCVAAAVNVNHLCCLPGAVLGGWGILGLVRDEGRAYFGIRPAARRRRPGVAPQAI